jgi:glycosyltransferase involved in cell wall biosynthesis
MLAPTVSVLMPVFNSQRYVAEAVESILNQSFRDFEFLIVDDGSTDGSAEILRTYSARDARIELVRRPNTGYVHALVEMLARARGVFVARMDSDDVAEPERFARQIEFLTTHEDHVAVGCDVLYIDPDGAPISSRVQLREHDEIDALMMGGTSGAIMHPAAMLRRSTLCSIGGYDLRYRAAEDYDLFLRLAERGRLANLGQTLLKYRLHDRSVSHLQRSLQMEEMQTILAAAHARRGSHPPDRLRCHMGPAPSLHGQRIAWAWMALGSRFTTSARKNALAAVRMAPWSYAAWRVLVETFRK